MGTERNKSSRRVYRRLPRYLQIAETLREEIESSATPGDRLPSCQELADRFETGRFVIEEAFDVLAHQGLIERREGQTAWVRKEAAKARHVAVFSELFFGDPAASFWHVTLSYRLIARLEAAGLDARLYMGSTTYGMPFPQTPSCPEFIRALETDSVSAVVAVVTAPEQNWHLSLAGKGIPVLGQHPRYPYSVQVDYEGMVRQGLRHLASLGRRRPALLWWRHLAMARPGVREAFLEEVRELGLGMRDEWLRPDVDMFAPDAPSAAFDALWNRSGERPDSLLILDDLLLHDLVYALAMQRVVVPDDLAIVAHANRGNDRSGGVPVARLELDPNDGADAMGEMLETLLRGEPPRREHVFLAAKLLPQTPAP